MTIFDELTTLANLGLVALTLVVAFVVVLRAIDRLLIPAIDIQPFTGGEETDTAVGGMADIVRSELVRLTEEGSGSSMYFFNGPDQQISLPDDINVEPLDTFAKVVNWLPGRVTTITGRVQPDGSHGRGVTVTINSGWMRPGASTTIWERDIGIWPPPDDPAPSGEERWQRLAIAAAAWVAYRLVATRSARERTALLTQDWQSYALFLTATRLTRQGADADAIRPIYQAALERDPRNRGALFGLGVLFANESANGRAAELFDACVEELEYAYDEDGDEYHRDRLWYRANLNAAIARLNEAALLEALEQNEPTGVAYERVPGARVREDPATLVYDASEKLEKVAAAADSTIATLVGDAQPVLHGPYADLVRFLVKARESAAVSWQTTR